MALEFCYNATPGPLAPSGPENETTKKTNKQARNSKKQREGPRPQGSKKRGARARKGAKGRGARARKGAEGEAASSAVAQGASRELASKTEQQTTRNSKQTNNKPFSGPDGALGPGVALQQNPRVIDRMMAATMQPRAVSSSHLQRNFLFFESG